MVFNMNEGVSKLAKILKADEQLLESTVATMEKIIHAKGVVDDILLENETSIKKTLGFLGITGNSGSEISKAFEDVLVHDDAKLFTLLGQPDLGEESKSALMLEKAYEAVGGKPTGLFLKRQRARDMLMQTPPPSILRGLGYTTVDELLEKERLEEIFAALRFIESRQWMNEVFVKHYEQLTPNDFEERQVEMLILPHKWLSLAEEFVEKKYHNVSHLKELGVVFVIPIKIDVTGETLRLFSLLLHYLNEVPFYASLIRKYASDADSFAGKLTSLIRGDVGEMVPESSPEFVRWLIVQRYLAKDDPIDRRLFLPHVNPEAIHWRKAQKALIGFSRNYPELKLPLFHDLDYVGDFFGSNGDSQVLVSFDLVDNVMGLVENGAPNKYLYHHQEALWNRLFSGFVGEERMEELVIAHFDQGYIELTL